MGNFSYIVLVLMAFFGISVLAYNLVSRVISTVRKQLSLQDRLTEKALRAVDFAKDETERAGQRSVSSEMLLIGLMLEGTGIAAKTLRSAGLDVERVRVESKRIIDARVNPTNSAFTLTGERVIEMAWKESKELGHAYIGTEHLLLALIEAGEDLTCQVLDNLSIDRNSLRTKVWEMLG